MRRKLKAKNECFVLTLSILALEGRIPPDRILVLLFIVNWNKKNFANQFE